jgi:BioD-like phosphotransacetylase family protein
MNTCESSVPRVYIAATRQNEGKTTTSIGVITLLKEHFDKLAFIKPVGQHYVEMDNHRIDADAVLMRNIFGCSDELRDMSPVTVDRTFTRRYTEHPDPDMIENAICESFNRVAAGKDIVVIEGTGHAGVGSIIDYNNAKVAALLNAPAVMVTSGGIGRPFDEIMLNQALFEKNGVQLIGVVINKVNINKLKEIEYYMKSALQRAGLPLLGVIPRQERLLHPTISHVVNSLDAELINGESNLGNNIQAIIIGAMTPHQALHYINHGTLIITPGDRDDLVLAAISLATTSRQYVDRTIAGIILTGGIQISEDLLTVINRTDIPVLLCNEDTYSVASQINNMMIKIQPDETQKITIIQQMFKEYFKIDLLMEQLEKYK